MGTPIAPRPPARGTGLRSASARLTLLAPLLLALLAACKTLLPSGEEAEPLPWQSYREAYDAVEQIEPYHSTRESLRASGIDPAVNPAITILSFTALLQRLPAVSAVTPGHLERGLAECLDAGKRCTAYSIEVRQVRTRRVGNFWLDMLNFRRKTTTTGWSLSALVFFIDDQVVYALAGGQPNINSDSETRNPLGPLQGIGTSLRTPLN